MTPLAVEDLTQAIKLDPKYAMAYSNRGAVWAKKNQSAFALKDCHRAIMLDPKDAAAYSTLAWVSATSPDERHRDGKVAVEHATKACEITFWKDWFAVATLAAAHAEIGDFTNAVKWIEKAITLAPDSEKQAAKAALDLYRSKKPYRYTPNQIKVPPQQSFALSAVANHSENNES